MVDYANGNDNEPYCPIRRAAVVVSPTKIRSKAGRLTRINHPSTAFEI
jgi:hypothetical protein